MATLIPSAFSKYSLSPEETKSGQTLNIYNVQVIQNLISEAAEEKISLEFNPLNPSIFIQREAELQGQIRILQYLLACSAEMSQEVVIE